MTAHEPLRPLTGHAISPPSNMIIPFSNSISPMETPLPVCPFRQGRFPFAGVCCARFKPSPLRERQRHTVLQPQGENIAVRRCLPCVRGGGTALCAVTEGLQIPAAVQERAYQSLSQPDGCQLPLHKGAKGCGTEVRCMTGAAERSGFSSLPLEGKVARRSRRDG